MTSSAQHSAIFVSTLLPQGSFKVCQEDVEPGAGWYDLTRPRAADPFPPPYMHGFLTQESVLSSLGVPVNFTTSSRAVGTTFSDTFDIVHGGFLDAIGALLDAGVKVHLVHGDRDYPCNWVGGEAASLAVPYLRAAEFARAGYAPLQVVTTTSTSREGPEHVHDGPTTVKEAGMTRQHGNFSFTRVSQAGHEVPAYQLAAAHEIFRRATLGLDIPTGQVCTTTGDAFSTVGPGEVWHIKGVRPVAPAPRCYILSPKTCVPEVWKKVLAGAVSVKDWFVVDGKDNGRGESPLDEL